MYKCIYQLHRRINATWAIQVNTVTPVSVLMGEGVRRQDIQAALPDYARMDRHREIHRGSLIIPARTKERRLAH